MPAAIEHPDDLGGSHHPDHAGPVPGQAMPGIAPALSVVIPAYNVGSYVGRAVESVLDQTCQDIEVIVVDDGSTDDTAEILASIARDRRDGRLVIVRQANSGLSAARNAGIRRARGRFVGFLDGDDAWHPKKAERHIALMDVDSSAMITFSHSVCIGEDGEPTGVRLETGKPELLLDDLIRSNLIGNGSTPVVRRECFEAVGLFRETLRSCEDYDLWCRILSLPGARAVLVPELLTFYRIRHDSLTFDFERFLGAAEDVMRRLRQDFPEIGERVLREGHAEHYRIAAWKAATTKRRWLALRYLSKALRICPWLPLLDLRASGTLAAIILPGNGLSGLQAIIGSVKGRKATGPHSAVS